MGRILLLVFCSIICGVLSIDIDYYLGIMRSLDCTYQKDDCSKYCLDRPSICHKGECYCHKSVLDIVVNTEINLSRGTVSTTEVERPALRHHIAHFCPNLDEARVCISKCMQLGKPAFCGKDHKCYCGHRHNPHSKDNAADKDTYANFKDLYEKYFGKQPNDRDVIVESN